ncbi:hypothetical protein Pcinc_009328 [Petrolisthes cinctipes]|uniref:Uncharacterized protein n=1 Tax=Petrolisthes cinctipes TaxID=88211 RepID=A0AAE1GBH4_PETCI|nr:hypothetical protein Pcinc_009328 [Petrolisthes cinctipes]
MTSSSTLPGSTTDQGYYDASPCPSPRPLSLKGRQVTSRLSISTNGQQGVGTTNTRAIHRVQTNLRGTCQVGQVRGAPSGITPHQHQPAHVSW